MDALELPARFELKCHADDCPAIVVIAVRPQNAAFIRIGVRDAAIYCPEHAPE